MDRKCILCVFAHPDDETSCAGGTLARYAREGVEAFVVTATRGEEGTLGTSTESIAREALPQVREAELGAVLKSYGVHPPVLLGYRDQELKSLHPGKLLADVLAVMERVRPQVVITFGPTGISRHDDHIAVYKATVEAFHQYRRVAEVPSRLFYVALPEEVSRQFDLDIQGPEIEPTLAIDIKEYKSLKVQGLRMYRSQEDAQWLAGLIEATPMGETEWFHQAYPPVAEERWTGFWH